MVLGFLAIERVGQVATVAPVEGGGGNRGQRYSLVSRAEQQVEVDFTVDDGVGVKIRQGREVGAAVEDAGIEKVRAHASRLQREFAETQGAAGKAVFDEAGLIFLHGQGGAGWWTQVMYHIA